MKVPKIYSLRLKCWTLLDRLKEERCISEEMYLDLCYLVEKNRDEEQLTAVLSFLEHFARLLRA